MAKMSGGHTYRDHKRCIACSEWKSKELHRCDTCNTKLRTRPRNKPNRTGKQFQIEVKRI